MSSKLVSQKIPTAVFITMAETTRPTSVSIIWKSVKLTRIEPRRTDRDIVISDLMFRASAMKTDESIFLAIASLYLYSAYFPIAEIKATVTTSGRFSTDELPEKSFSMELIAS